MRASLGLVLLLAFAPGAQARSIGEKTVENNIRPVYGRLAEAMDGLSQATDTFCEGGQKDRGGLNSAFKQAVLAWAGAEHLRFGPIMEENRYERFAFWPDPKGLGPKQIAAALRDKDAGVISPEGLAQKSVALQGLTAFEALFWSDPEKAAAAPPDAQMFRCGFGKAIAKNLAQVAAVVRMAWAGDDGFAGNLIAPGAAKVYHDEKDVTLELFKAFRTALQRTRTVKLNRILMGDPSEAQPRRAAFWRSGNAIGVIAANVAAVKAVFETCGLNEIVHNAGEGMDRATLDQFHLIEQALDALADKPIADITASPKSWAQLNSVVFGLINIQTTGGNAIAEAAQLPMSFNSLDGD